MPNTRTRMNQIASTPITYLVAQAGYNIMLLCIKEPMSPVCQCVRKWWCKSNWPYFFLCRLQEKIARISLNRVWSQTFPLHALQRKGISVHLLQILYTSSLKPLTCCDGTNEKTICPFRSSRRALKGQSNEIFWLPFFSLNGLSWSQ